MIVANMASFPARRNLLDTVIEKLIPQVDCLNLCLNEYQSIPKELAKYDRLNPFIPDIDYKDVGKFVPAIANSDYVALVDDDIIYPDDYILKLEKFYETYEHLQIVIGCHGIIYPDLYEGSIETRKVFEFYEKLESPRVVNQLGSGTIFLKGKQMPALPYMYGSQKYVDVRFCKYLHEQKISLVCIPREKHWLREIISNDTIFKNFTSNWPANVIREVQYIAGYRRLNLPTVIQIEG